MRVLFAVMLFGLLVLVSAASQAAPQSVSCRIALEKLHKAQTAMLDSHRAFERAQIQEDMAVSETLTCLPGGTFYLKNARRCSRARAQAPHKIKAALQAKDRYLQEKWAFEDRLVRAETVCNREP